MEQLRVLARRGAEEALKRLRAEIIAIERMFPELALPRRRRAVRQAVRQTRTRTRTMSAAARKAVSERMKKYWAERRKARGKVQVGLIQALSATTTLRDAWGSSTRDTLRPSLSYCPASFIGIGPIAPRRGRQVVTSLAGAGT